MPISTRRAFSFIQCSHDCVGVSPSGSLIQDLSRIDILDCSGALAFPLELSQFPKSISVFGWIGHSVHEQVDVVRPVFEIVEWFKVVEAVHELIKVLIERGLNWFRNPNVSRFR